MRSATLLALLAGTAVVLPAQRRPVPAPNRPATLELTAAIVLEDMSVRPLAQFPLAAQGATDTTHVTAFRTDLSGRAAQELAPGRYLIRSAQPATIGSHRYTWAVPVTLQAGQTLRLELTALNAAVESVVAEPPRAGDAELYTRTRSGVVRVEAGGGHGSGWLIDAAPGLIVTNHHVIAGARTIAVQVDSLTKVRGAVVSDDAVRDIAVLRIAHDACAACYQFKMATPRSSGAVIAVGEKVIALGYPLNQTTVPTMTTGIVSSLREKAIISDVNLNHGNSGGPMLDATGAVVGVNTFGDISDQGGPGISGAILISEVVPVLKHALDTLGAVAEPPGTRLRTLPLVAYPVDGLKRFANDDVKRRDGYENINGGDFQIDLITPPFRYVRRLAIEREVSKERRKREERAGVAASERYQASDEPDWAQYVGENAPAVIVWAYPKIGETGKSKFLRAFVGAASGVNKQARFVYKADLDDMTLYRAGAPVEPIARYRFPYAIYVNNRQVRMNDVAYYLVYLYPEDAFAPDSAGGTPPISIGVKDLKHPDRGEKRVDLKPDVTGQIWGDFAPWREVTTKP